MLDVISAHLYWVSPHVCSIYADMTCFHLMFTQFQLSSSWFQRIPLIWTIIRRLAFRFHFMITYIYHNFARLNLIFTSFYLIFPEFSSFDLISPHFLLVSGDVYLTICCLHRIRPHFSFISLHVRSYGLFLLHFTSYFLDSRFSFLLEFISISLDFTSRGFLFWCHISLTRFHCFLLALT